MIKVRHFHYGRAASPENAAVTLLKCISMDTSLYIDRAKAAMLFSLLLPLGTEDLI